MQRSAAWAIECYKTASVADEGAVVPDCGPSFSVQMNTGNFLAEMKLLQQPKVPIDLNAGFPEQFLAKDELRKECCLPILQTLHESGRVSVVSR